MLPETISKVLSANDTGESGGHQAGILVPKERRILAFFPTLDPKEYNPRCHLLFQDDSGQKWEFAFIYYNNALFGGSRNEYRLTRMTRYIRESGLVIGDEVILSRDTSGKFSVSYSRKAQPNIAPSGRLKLGSGWRVINL